MGCAGVCVHVWGSYYICPYFGFISMYDCVKWGGLGLGILDVLVVLC